ncbi:helix-turn-helix domain-containing protein [bacterium BMS3Abin03]|jgi:transcriptional regulator with XRE-family HTH domain|nr:helix-turn-helix domain-containing protein [bacterium BMS3Abin03]MCG6958363.1 helix-turn-helix domain-containing protein [bacterium BMS3Abin03]
MFKSRLNQIMRAQKISGKEISIATGISESTISKFLSGNQEPKYSQIIKIAQALNFSPEVFMSLLNPQFNTHPPLINEYFMLRETYNEKYSNLVITTFHAFKDFEVKFDDIVDPEALYISIILEGSVESKFGTFRKGDYHVNRGDEIKNIKATIFKNTKTITFVITDKGKSIPENSSQLILNFKTNE